jgi:hypothetical protein
LLGSLGFIEPDGTVISWPTVGAGVNYSTDWIAYPGVLLQPGTYQGLRSKHVGLRYDFGRNGIRPRRGSPARGEWNPGTCILDPGRSGAAGPGNAPPQPLENRGEEFSPGGVNVETRWALRK